MKRIKFVGLDVHAETIAVAIAEQNGEVRSLGVIPNREDSVRKLVRKLGAVEELRFCYEAGPTGYVLYWQLTRMGAKCEVVAPTLVPVKSGDRVKTDRRDALKLARNYRAGELTPVWVPDAAHEALRDLVRAREAAKKDELRARHRLNKFLLRQGRRPPMGVKLWTIKYLEWVKREVHFEQLAQEATLLDYLHEVEHAAARIARLDGAIEEAVKVAPPKMRAVIEALQALRGVAHVSAVTVVAELGELSRFARAKQLMGYGGIVASEDSSGERTRRGNITKTGNAHLRRVVVEAALGLPTPTRRGSHLAQAARACQRRGQRNRLESTTTVTWTVSEVVGQGQEQGSRGHGGRPRVAGFHLGHRDKSRNRTEGVPAAGRVR